jgi:hypothetical protein
MFGQLNLASMRRRRVMACSLVVHGLVLAWLLKPLTPLRIEPNSVAIGQMGTSVTRLYWPSKSLDASKNSSSDTATQKYKKQRLGQNQLTFQAPRQAAQAARQDTPVRAESQDNSKTQTLSALGHGAPAGLPYGTLHSNQFYGDEVRPALPVQTSDPSVFPWQLPLAPGNEVIEITIDERGEIVDKKVLQSLGSYIDLKCLAALENWHFHPATRNGAPIPSKQDAIFPFKARA